MNESDSRPSPLPASQPVCGANFWIRAAAHTIDFSILMLLSCLISIPLFIRMLRQGLATGLPTISYPVWVDIVYQLVLAVGMISLWRKTQTTPGKAIFRLKIVDLRDGSLPSVPRLVIRFFAYLVATVPIPLPLIAMAFPSLKNTPLFGLLSEDWRMLVPLMLGFLWILVDSRNRGWHDLLSGTVTVKKPPVPGS